MKVPGHKNPLNQEETVVLAEDILQVDIDKKTSAIYVVFADGRFRSGKTVDVSLTHSTDGGEFL